MDALLSTDVTTVDTETDSQDDMIVDAQKNDTEKVADNREKIADDTLKVSGGTDKTVGDAEKITDITEKLAANTEKLSDCTEKIIVDTSEATVIIKKITNEDQDTQKIKVDSQKSSDTQATDELPTGTLEITDKPEKMETELQTNEDTQASASTQSDIRTDSDSDVTKTPKNKGKVKRTDYGTPVMNIASAYLKLPSDDKFAKDICDVINFENLPNSTGKYKQISTLLKKVKSEVDRIQDS